MGVGAHSVTSMVAKNYH